MPSKADCISEDEPALCMIDRYYSHMMSYIRFSLFLWVSFSLFQLPVPMSN